MKTFNTTSEAYLATLTDVLDSPEYICAPRGQMIREITDYQFRVLHPNSEPIITLNLDRNVKIAEYTAKEKTLYDSGTNKVEDFAKASKFWTQLANPNGTVNSAYGFLIFKNRSHGNKEFESLGEDLSMRTPWEWCVESLKADKDTRQAILRFNLPEHAWIGNKDFPCTMHGVFQIREDRLNFSIVMRSQDMVKGAAYDWPWFISLMEKMVDELKPTYPSLNIGAYTHAASSIHIYEKNLDIINKMLGRYVQI